MKQKKSRIQKLQKKTENKQRNNYKMKGTGEEEEKWKTPRRTYKIIPKKITDRVSETEAEQNKTTEIPPTKEDEQF